MSETTDAVRVATPPRMVCQNCGETIYNYRVLGWEWLHVVTDKAECKRGKSRQARARRAAKKAAGQ